MNLLFSLKRLASPVMLRLGARMSTGRPLYLHPRGRVSLSKDPAKVAIGTISRETAQTVPLDGDAQLLADMVPNEAFCRMLTASIVASLRAGNQQYDYRAQLLPGGAGYLPVTDDRAPGIDFLLESQRIALFKESICSTQSVKAGDICAAC